MDPLASVHPDLQRVVLRAREGGAQFRVLEGRRTYERQVELVAAGASHTLLSRHLTGHAVDLGALVGGEVRWDWPLYYALAVQMQYAVWREQVPTIWGGCWGLLTTIGDPETAVAEYAAAARASGRRPLIDGPHYELAREAYPEVERG